MDDTPYVRGVNKLAQRIRTIRERLGVAAMVEEVGALLLRRTQDRYDKEVDPDGRPWVPLAKTTLQRRRRAGGISGKKILVQTGALRASIQLIRGGLSGAIATNTGAGVRIGVADEEQLGKAATHNYGRVATPMRKFLGIGRLDIRAVDSFMRRRANKLEDSL